MSNLSDFVGSNFQLVASSAMSKGDLAEMLPDGTAMSAKSLYNTFTTVTPSVSMYGNANTTYSYVFPSNPIAADPTGTQVYFCGNVSNTAPYGTFFSYNKVGAYGGANTTQNPDSGTTGNQCFTRAIAVNSNGVVCVGWADSGGTGGPHKYACYSAGLAGTLLGATLMNPASSNSQSASAAYYGNISIAALTGNNFVIATADATNNRLCYAIINNSGGSVVAPTVLDASTPSSPIVNTIALSNGNVLIAWNGWGGTSIKYTILGPTGSVILATTTITISGSTSFGNVYLSAMSGYFAMMYGGSSNHTIKVFNNAGSLQGTCNTTNTYNPTYPGYGTIMNDGTQFWVLYQTTTWTTFGQPSLGTVSTAGVFAFVGLLPNIPINTYNAPMTANIEATGMMFVTIANGGTTYQRVYNLKGNLICLSAISDLTSQSNNKCNIAYLGELTYAWTRESTAGANSLFSVGRTVTPTLLGVAVAAAAAGAKVPVQVQRNGGGGFASGFNSVSNGALARGLTFDHSSTGGNKGTLSLTSGAFKGI